MPVRVVVPVMAVDTGPFIPAGAIAQVLCNRTFKEDEKAESEEQYLVKWVPVKGESPSDAVVSWHALPALKENLDRLQDYLEQTKPSLTRKKRKHREDDHVVARASPAERSSTLSDVSRATTPVTRDSVDSFSQAENDYNVYNGSIEVKQNLIKAVPSSRRTIPRIDATTVPEQWMVQKARESRTTSAENAIRSEVIRRLGQIQGPEVRLLNTVDSTSPSLRFDFISKNVLGEGVYAAEPATRTACTKCRTDMGKQIGCEYSKVCDCLEYAAVQDTTRMLPDERERWEKIKADGGGDTSGLPKRFPYYNPGSTIKAGCLVSQYLLSRYPIYECNENCPCGPNCKTRVVQKGRKVRLDIFKTANRGWGLRTRDFLHEGQFIDTYRGEIITDEEATRREESSKNSKDSYLYSLDKFAEVQGWDDKDLYVIDGESKGGPTRFINHSCAPNCRQYAVSYNKHDPRVYEIAFFAIRNIAQGEELVFDYLDKDEVEEVDDLTDPAERKDGGIKPTQCLCGSKKCRKWLWL